MTRVPVDLAGAPYDILVAPGAFGQIAGHLRGFARAGRLLGVTDEGVAAHWLEPLRAVVTRACTEVNNRCGTCSVPAAHMARRFLQQLLVGHAS